MATNWNRAFTVTVFSKVALLFLGIGSSIVVVRTLGTEIYGYYTFVTLVISLCAIFSNIRLGVSNAFYLASKQFSVSVLVKVSLLSSLITGGIAAIIALIIFSQKGILHNQLNMLGVLLAISIIPMTVCYEYLAGVLRGLKRFILFNTVKLFGTFIRLVIILSFYLVLKGLDIQSIIYIDWLVALLSLLILIWGIRDKKWWRSSENFDKNILYTIHLNGGITFIYILIASINTKIDLIYISMLCKPEELGFYNIAARFAYLIWIVFESLQLVLLPKFSSNDDSERLSSVVRIFKLSVMLSFALLVMLLVCGSLIITPLYGAAFANAVPPFQVLVVGATIYVLHKVISTYYIASNKVYLIAKYSALALLVNIVANYFLVKFYGIIGAAVGTSVSYAIATVALIISIAKESNRTIFKIVVPDKEAIKDGWDRVNLMCKDILKINLRG